MTQATLHAQLLSCQLQSGFRACNLSAKLNSVFSRESRYMIIRNHGLKAISVVDIGTNFLILRYLDPLVSVIQDRAAACSFWSSDVVRPQRAVTPVPVVICTAQIWAQFCWLPSVVAPWMASAAQNPMTVV